ncbi:alpha/beta hydrolase family esterase [Ramlibacter rhizophilus]|uniref:PHB depolymerase family esterase n=1 Tax=Ramlibacter rhizophilus TaxID=1781167 RepID=A0A4Z0C113_9BURK|nr:PHB depolymerase family esterase [Ramlibacter rhizophilus]TFZ04494.1 PHB depolymerase family esterase [Ramlibacter rhizophilus]
MPTLHKLLQGALSLTQRGDLQAATTAIQAALARHAGPAPLNGDQVIDVQAFVTPGRFTLPGAGHRGPIAPPAPESTDPRFTAGRYANNSGHRDYKLFVPPQAGTRPLPLVVMLHGCTQNPDDFAAGTAMNELAQQEGFYVLYPAQSRKSNPQGCWNWFKHTHQARGRGEPALLAEMTRQVMGQHTVDPNRVYVAGLSAGGAMAAILGETYPDLFAAIGVHSGLPAKVASDLPSALAAMRSGPADARASALGRVPAIVFHGDADTTVHPSNGEHIVRASAGATQEVSQARAPGGRDYTRSVRRGENGAVLAEHWLVHGAPHAWSGGSGRGSYTDPQGPDASAEMLRFFLEHPRATPL